jgi:hypothetical protein
MYKITNVHVMKNLKKAKRIHILVSVSKRSRQFKKYINIGRRKMYIKYRIKEKMYNYNTYNDKTYNYIVKIQNV